MKTMKKFDCVAMKRQAATALYEQLKTMTPEEQLAYWKRGTDQLRQQQALLRAQKT
jgi:hypothetical protein